MKKLLFLILLSSSYLCSGQIPKLDKYCAKITTETDKFSGEIKSRSPIDQITFMKNKTDEKMVIYGILDVVSRTASTGKGVYILFENGEKIVRKDKHTRVSVMGSALHHTAIINLTEDEIELIKNYNITDIRLYIHDAVILNPIKYRAYMTCLCPENK